LSDAIDEIKFVIVSRKNLRVSSQSVHSLLAGHAALRYEERVINFPPVVSPKTAVQAAIVSGNQK
jgi:hypothetical protein